MDEPVCSECSQNLHSKEKRKRKRKKIKTTCWPCSFPELIGGTPSLKMNHGSGTLVLQLANNVGVADRRWHRLDVRSNSKVRETQFFLFVFFPPPGGGAGTEPSRRGGMITHVRAPAAAEIDPASLAALPL